MRTIDNVLADLESMAADDESEDIDRETRHIKADALLLEAIEHLCSLSGSSEMAKSLRRAYEGISKWYA